MKDINEIPYRNSQTEIAQLLLEKVDRKEEGMQSCSQINGNTFHVFVKKEIPS